MGVANTEKKKGEHFFRRYQKIVSEEKAINVQMKMLDKPQNLHVQIKKKERKRNQE